MTAASNPDDPGPAVTYGRRELLGVAVVLFVVSAVVGSWLVLRVRSGTPAAASGVASVVGIVLSGVVTVGVTVVVHEFVHAVVGTVLGYRVRVGVTVTPLSFYTVAPDQYWTRRDLLVAAVAPLAIIDVAAVTAILVAPPWVAVSAVLALMTNSVGSAADLLVVARVITAPTGTRFYDAGDAAGYVVDAPD